MNVHNIADGKIDHQKIQADLPSLLDMFTDSEVMKYIGPRRVLTQNETEEWLLNILYKQDRELTRYAVVLKETDELIGVAGLQDEDGIKDFAYYFRRSHWGKDMHRKLVQQLLTTLKTLFKSEIIKSSLLMKI